MNKRLHTENINGTTYRVIVRENSGLVQIWADYPPGMSAGFPECTYSGDINGARNSWKAIDKAPRNPLTGLKISA